MVSATERIGELETCQLESSPSTYDDVIINTNITMINPALHLLQTPNASHCPSAKTEWFHYYADWLVFSTRPSILRPRVFSTVGIRRLCCLRQRCSLKVNIGISRQGCWSAFLELPLRPWHTVYTSTEGLLWRPPGSFVLSSRSIGSANLLPSYFFFNNLNNGRIWNTSSSWQFVLAGGLSAWWECGGDK